MLSDIAFGIVIGVTFISLVVLFCTLLVKLYIHKVKVYTNVIYQKDIDFQKALNTTIIETQELVLNNISQDLHDDAGQQLTYMNFQLENLKLDSAQYNIALEPLSQSVNNLSQSIRSISHSLNNQILTRQDLINAITAETDRLQKNGQLSMNLTFSDNCKRSFSTNEKIVIYRIFQEIINNAFKHAKANRIDIAIQTTPTFEMSISDNGDGFDYDTKSDIPTLGLRNIIARAEIINYKVGIQSRTGAGTTVTLSEAKPGS